MRARVVFALLVIGFSRPVFGQSNPGDVVRAFFKAEDEGRWLDAARMLDLKSFEPIQRNAVTASRRQGTFRQTTAEDLMKFDPDMPRAAAEYQVKRMNESRRTHNYLLEEFARVTSVDSLAALSTEQAAARWLEAQGPEWKMEVSAKDSRTAPKVDCPELSDSAKRALIVQGARMLPRATILGVTERSDSLRFVVVGEDYGSVHISDPGVNGPSLSPHVVTLVNSAGAWKIVPTLDMPRSNGFGGMTTFAIACGKGTLEGVDQKK